MECPRVENKNCRARLDAYFDTKDKIHHRLVHLNSTNVNCMDSDALNKLQGPVYFIKKLLPPANNEAPDPLFNPELEKDFCKDATTGYKDDRYIVVRRNSPHLKYFLEKALHGWRPDRVVYQPLVIFAKVFEKITSN